MAGQSKEHIFAQQDSADGDRKGTLRVKFRRLRSNAGILRVALFDNAKAYPGASDKTVRSSNVELAKMLLISGGDVIVTFTDLHAGFYAISAFHDENSNGKLDTYWYGAPREGIAASNDPHPLMRAARFDEAKFELPDSGRTIGITVYYR